MKATSISVSSASLVAVLLAACVANPATGVGANGQQLRLRSESGIGKEVTNDVVGESTLRDARGNETTVEHRADVEHSYAWHDYSFFQGRSAIDEQDFYRLAGDQRSEAEVRRRRAGIYRLQRIGGSLILGSLLAGTALAALGIANNNTGLAVGGTVGGIVLMSPGFALWLGGRSRMRVKVLPEKRAMEAADVVEVCVSGRCRTRPGGR